MSSIFCVYPWIHAYISPTNEIFPCCIAGDNKPMGEFTGQSSAEVINTPALVEFRKDLLAGQPRPDYCRDCYKQEAISGESTRTYANQLFSETAEKIKTSAGRDGSIRDPKMLYVDVRFSNVCNFRCRYCGPQSSTLLNQERIRLGLPSLEVADRSKEKLRFYMDNLGQVERLAFYGGEPLICEEHYLLLEELIRLRKTDIPIFYNTNISVLKHKGHDVLKLWKQFSQLDLSFSLDESHERAAYVRKGTDWAQIENNIEQVRECCPQARIRPTITVSIFNALRVPALIRYFWEKKIIFPKHSFRLGIVFNPSEHMVHVLPLNQRLSVYKKAEAVLEEIGYAPVKNFHTYMEMLRAPTVPLASQFKKSTEFWDKARGESFAKTFPEMAGWYEGIQSL